MCTKRSFYRSVVSPTPNIHKALFTIPVENRKSPPSSSHILSIKHPSLDDDVENLRVLFTKVDKESFPLPFHKKKSLKLTPTLEDQNVPKKNGQNWMKKEVYHSLKVRSLILVSRSRICWKIVIHNTKFFLIASHLRIGVIWITRLFVKKMFR